ncbi:TPA: hypothetical protein JBG70_14875 [Legionella pneumophila]|nr:hypothetical protein [Legionella pneumophila subsp. pneumophila]HAU0497364.1 hypothetical protein [Legionella pneumophila]HAU0697208.1 hypothetical protein [Legionella pneumophila]HAU0818050.1 hypothetical protein [Legionella pneumophila]HAU0875226.1 hypothetical protein [Legionella pneumophila]
MENELKNWIQDRVKSRNSISLNTNNFLANSAFGQHDKNNLLFDFSITLKRNNAIIEGEWEVIEDAISFNNSNWDASKLDNLVKDIIQHLKKGGKFYLNRNPDDPQYLINRK